MTRRQLALSMVVLCVACTPEPPVRFAIDEVTVEPSISAGATVCVDFHLFDAAGEATAPEGSLLVEWLDRAPEAPAGSGAVTWSRVEPIAANNFHDYLQGGGRFIFGCRDACVPPEPAMVREVRVTFTPTGRPAFPSALATGPFPQQRWMTAHEVMPPPIAMATPADLEPLRAFASELVAALALADAATARRCEGIAQPPSHAPLVDRDDIVALDGGMHDRVFTIPSRDVRTHPRFRRLVGLIASTAGARLDEVRASAAELSLVGPLVWIRSIEAREDGRVIPGSAAVPDQFEPGTLRGTLTLVDRRAGAVLCRAPFVATSSPSVEIRAHVEGGHSTIEGEPLRADLDMRGGDALEDARASLLDDPSLLRFERDVAPSTPPEAPWPGGRADDGLEPTF